jgi:hypothetical protein
MNRFYLVAIDPVTRCPALLTSVQKRKAITDVWNSRRDWSPAGLHLVEDAGYDLVDLRWKSHTELLLVRKIHEVEARLSE